KLGLSKEFVPFSFTFIGYILVFNIYSDIVKRSQFGLSKNYIILCFIPVLLTIHFLVLTDWLRTGLSLHVLFYGIYFYTVTSKKSQLFICILIALIIHPVSILLGFPLLITR